MDAAAEEALFGEFLDEDDLGGDEDGGLAGLVRNGDFDGGLHIVLLAALEAQAAFGHVLADDDVVFALGLTNACGVADFDARMLAAIDARSGGFFVNRRRNGKDGRRRLPLRLPAKLPDKVGAGGVNSGWR